MRLLLTICSLAALVYAKPQGYNYGTGISGGGSTSTGGFSGAPSFLGASSQQQSKYQSGGGGFGSGGGIGVPSFGIGGGIGVPSFGSGFNAGGIGSGFSTGGSSSGFSQSQQQSSSFEAPFVHKQFITVSAPEDQDSLEHSKHLVIGRPQKNYRVVFIKAPSSTNANVKLSAEYAPQEEKTVIYVLSKKDSSLEINDIATPAPTVPAKPEVFFIKYKTEQEAQHAQRQIQAEYDKIEGSSEHTDAGVAPQQSVVGILGDGGSQQYSSGFSGGVSSGSSFSSSAKSSNYLPPNRV